MRWVMLDRILTMEASGSATGLKAVAGSEDYFEHHFPTFPVVPGVLVLEMMGNLAGRLGIYSWLKKSGKPMTSLPLGVESVRYHRFVRPGSVVNVSAALGDLDELRATFQCEAHVDGEVISTCVCEHHFFEPGDPGREQAILEDLRALWPECDV